MAIQINTVGDLINVLSGYTSTSQIRIRGLYIQPVTTDSTGTVQLTTLGNTDEVESKDVNT